MVRSTCPGAGGHGQGDGGGGIERVGIVGTQGKGCWPSRLAGHSAGRALVGKDEDAAEVASGALSQHHQIGVAIAVDIAGEDLIALAEQGIVAFESGYLVGPPKPHQQCRTDGQVASEHRYIQQPIAVEISGGYVCLERLPVEQGVARPPPARGVLTPQSQAIRPCAEVRLNALGGTEQVHHPIAIEVGQHGGIARSFYSERRFLDGRPRPGQLKLGLADPPPAGFPPHQGGGFAQGLSAGQAGAHLLAVVDESIAIEDAVGVVAPQGHVGRFAVMPQDQQIHMAVTIPIGQAKTRDLGQFQGGNKLVAPVVPYFDKPALVDDQIQESIAIEVTSLEADESKGVIPIGCG